jgi:hypothetical protein
MAYAHVDVSRIPELARDLSDDATACLRFVEDFLVAWESRRARVEHGVGSPVIDDALAALLTLSTSSAMVGATTLSASAKALYSEARATGRIPTVGAERLAAVGAESVVELRHAVDGWRAGLAA